MYLVCTYLSDRYPNTIFPHRIPNIVIVCAKFASCALSHTKSHCDWIVSVNNDLKNKHQKGGLIKIITIGNANASTSVFAAICFVHKITLTCLVYLLVNFRPSELNDSFRKVSLNDIHFATYVWVLQEFSIEKFVWYLVCSYNVYSFLSCKSRFSYIRVLCNGGR